MQVPTLTPVNAAFFINFISMIRDLHDDVTIIFEERGVTFLSTDTEIYCVFLSKDKFINYNHQFDCTLLEKANEIYKRVVNKIQVVDKTTHKCLDNLHVVDINNTIFMEKRE